MTKTEIKEAIDLLTEKIIELKNWLVGHHTNPYMAYVAANIREYETERDRLLRIDSNLYPSLTEVDQATGKEVMLMYRNIPSPRDEQEMAVMNKIKERIRNYQS